MASAMRLAHAFARRASRVGQCPKCRVKGACVFVTPEHAPSLCLHEYKLVHAFVVSRLRRARPVGLARFREIQDEVDEFARRLQDYPTYDAGRLANPFVPVSIPEQSTLATFVG